MSRLVWKLPELPDMGLSTNRRQAVSVDGMRKIARLVREENERWHWLLAARVQEAKKAGMVFPFQRARLSFKLTYPKRSSAVSEPRVVICGSHYIEVKQPVRGCLIGLTVCVRALVRFDSTPPWCRSARAALSRLAVHTPSHVSGVVTARRFGCTTNGANAATAPVSSPCPPTWRH